MAGGSNGDAKYEIGCCLHEVLRIVSAKDSEWGPRKRYFTNHPFSMCMFTVQSVGMPKVKVTKEELLAHVWDLVHRNGYKATSIASVSAVAGIGKAGVLHHFSSKENMMIEVIQWARVNFRAYVLSAFAKTGNDPNGNAWTLETRFAEALRRQFRLVRRENAGCFFANSMLEVGTDPAFSHQLEGFFADWTDATEVCLRERFRPEEAKERTYRLWTDYQGSVMLFKTTGDRSHLDRYRDRSIASFGHPIFFASETTRL